MYICMYIYVRGKKTHISHMHYSLKAHFWDHMDQNIHKCAKCAPHGPGCASPTVNTSLSPVKLSENGTDPETLV